MPMIDVTYLRGSVEQRALEPLTDELVTALLRAERAPDTPFLRDNTQLYLHELDPRAQSVGGRGADPARADTAGCCRAGTACPVLARPAAAR